MHLRWCLQRPSGILNGSGICSAGLDTQPQHQVLTNNVWTWQAMNLHPIC